MDKKYYYRMLGLTGEPTPKQIKEAYEERIAKLNSADYRDDPEYAEKKRREATLAYKVLTGSAPSITKKQKRYYFEKFKDAIERREGNESAGRIEEEWREPEERRAEEPPKEDYRPKRGNTYKTSDSSGDAPFSYLSKAGNKKLAIGIVTVIVVFAVIFIGNATSISDSIADSFGGYDSEDDYDYDYGYEDAMSAEEIEEVDEIQTVCESLDFYAMLDPGSVDTYYEDINWYEGFDAYGEDELFDSTFSLLYNMGIYNMSGYFGYITGEPDFYFSNDDQRCADEIIQWMNAPSFSEVAGTINGYSGEPILCHSDYMEYLEKVMYENGYGFGYDI